MLYICVGLILLLGIAHGQEGVVPCSSIKSVSYSYTSSSGQFDAVTIPSLAQFCQGDDGGGKYYSYTGSDPGLSGLPALRTDNYFWKNSSTHVCQMEDGCKTGEEIDENDKGDRSACCAAKCKVGYSAGFQIIQPNTMANSWKVNTLVCTACPAGQYGAYASDDGINECLICPPGQYQELSKQTKCNECEAGKYFGMSALGAKSVDDCTTCGANEYANPVETGPNKGVPAKGQRECAACPTGYFILKSLDPTDHLTQDQCLPQELANEYRCPMTCSQNMDAATCNADTSDCTWNSESESDEPSCGIKPDSNSRQSSQRVCLDAAGQFDPTCGGPVLEDTGSAIGGGNSGGTSDSDDSGGSSDSDDSGGSSDSGGTSGGTPSCANHSDETTCNDATGCTWDIVGGGSCSDTSSGGATSGGTPSPSSTRGGTNSGTPSCAGDYSDETTCNADTDCIWENGGCGDAPSGGATPGTGSCNGHTEQSPCEAAQCFWEDTIGQGSCIAECSNEYSESNCIGKNGCTWEFGLCQGSRRRRVTGVETMTCVSCPKGYYGGQHQRRCVLCPSGYFSGRAKSNGCTKCDQGNCLFTLGSTSQTDIKQTDNVLLDINAKKADLQRTIRDPERTIDCLFFENCKNNLDPKPAVVRARIFGEPAKYASYSVCVVIILLLVATHRCMCFKYKNLDFMFAGSHFIDDTHAIRMFDTRLGSAFTMAIPFILVMLGILVFSDVTPINSKTLVPGSSIAFQEQKNIDYVDAAKKKWQNTQPINPNDDYPDELNLFGKIHIQLLAFAPVQNNFQCGSIINQKDFDDAPEVVGKTFECIRFEAENVTQEDKNGYRFCGLTVTCKAFNAFSGIHSVKLRFPDALQNIQWTVVPDVWSDTSDENAMVGHVLSPNNITDGDKLKTELEALGGAWSQTKIPDAIKWKIQKQNQLAGTSLNPTQVTLSVTRSKYAEEYGDKKFINWGLQTSFSNVKRVEEQDSGTPLGSHVVEFLFEVQESIYISQWTTSEGFVTKFGTVISLCLSIIAVLKFMKLGLELAIDKYLIGRAEKNKTLPPLDVLRRQQVLGEDRKEEIKKIRASLMHTNTDSRGIELVEVIGHSAVEEEEETAADKNETSDQDEGKIDSENEVAPPPLDEVEEEEEEEDVHSTVAALTTTVATLSAELMELKALMGSLLPSTVDENEVSNVTPSTDSTEPDEMEKKSISITIPEGTHPGNKINVNLPDGREIHITVPKGMKPGNTMTINYNKHGHMHDNDEKK